MQRVLNTMASAMLAASLLSAAPVRADDMLPYLHAPAADSTWVSWKTSKNKEAVPTVEYGIDPKKLDRVATGTMEDLSRANEGTGDCHKASGTYFYNRVKLTGLKPNTPYYYRVISGDQKSPIYRARTQPEIGSNTGHFRMLVIGDHQFTTKVSRDYEALLALAKAKVQEKFGGRFEDNINLMLNLGDQVDRGILCQYEDIHFKQAKSVISNIPTVTTVGNHEYYEDPNLVLYNAHFKSNEELSYRGLKSARPYAEVAFQVGNVLLVQADSNKSSAAQKTWVDKVSAEAKNDPSVTWMFASSHHPILSEQYPSDASAFIRDAVAPSLANSNKLTMYLAGHSNSIYARGSMREKPVHHLISGGAAWGQFWGQTAPVDYEDVQKTYEASVFQIVDIDQAARTMTVETWSIGNEKSRAQAGLLDRFVRRLDGPAPATPSVAQVPTQVQLPFTFASTAFEGSDRFGSIEYQIARNADFSEIIKSVKRDHENVYLSSGAPDYIPFDTNKDKDVTLWTLGENDLVASTRYFIRVRHRDQNLMWSKWSEPQAFVTLNGRPAPRFDPLVYFPLRTDLNDAMDSGFTVTQCGAPAIKGEEGGYLDTNAGWLLFNKGASGATCTKSGTTASLGLPKNEQTVATWVKYNSFNRYGGLFGLFQDNGSFERGWFLGSENQGATMGIATSTVLTYLTNTTNPLKANEWVHVAGVFNGLSMRLYINGKQVSVSTAQKGGINLPTTGWFHLGIYKDDDESFAHKGGLRDVALWERALGADEVAQLANGTRPNALPR